jgi:hypothetical protein
MNDRQGSYAWVVRSVWEALERRTGYPPCPLPGRNMIGAYCPVGCGGTLAITFLDSPPRWRVSSNAETPADPQPCPECGRRGGWLYTLDDQAAVCWQCHQLRLGGDGSLPEPGVENGANRCSRGCTFPEIFEALA